MTPFKEIYDLNTAIKTDTRLYSKPQNLIYQLYSNYLKYAISIFEYDCYQDITNNEFFKQIEFAFIGDGMTDTFTLDLTPIGDIFYITIDDVEIPITNYIYDNVNNQIKFNTIPTNNSNIYIANYSIGQFNVDLNNREKQILSEALNIPWLQQQINTDTLLNQMVYGADFKIYSQAEHIQQLNKTLKDQKDYVQNLITEYTYKQPKDLKGLGGGNK